MGSGALLLSPLTSWLSRSAEYHADNFAKAMAGADPMLSALAKLFSSAASWLSVRMKRVLRHLRFERLQAMLHGGEVGAGCSMASATTARHFRYGAVEARSADTGRSEPYVVASLASLRCAAHASVRSRRNLHTRSLPTFLSAVLS
jgi:hypothetical protein